MNKTLKHILAASLFAATLAFAGAQSANAQAASAATTQATAALTAGTSTQPAVIVHTIHPAPAQVTLHIGQDIIFAQDGPRLGFTDPVIKLSPQGSMDERSRSVDMQIRIHLGDEERVCQVYRATKTGTFTITVTHSVMRGVVAHGQPITITVVP